MIYNSLVVEHILGHLEPSPALNDIKYFMSLRLVGSIFDGFSRILVSKLDLDQTLSRRVYFLALGGDNFWRNHIAYVNTLVLSFCEEVMDVSMLTNVRYLHLWGCPNVMDVSMLGSVYHLDLYNCSGLTDVSGLGNNHYLDLRFCYGVTDTSNLANVKVLFLPDGKSFFRDKLQ